MPELLFEIDDEISSGVFPDLKQRKAPLFVDASNVIFADGAIQPIPAQSKLVKSQLNLPLLGLLTVVSGSTRTIFFGNEQKLYSAVIGGAVSELGSGYSSSTHWSFQKWGTWILASNGVDTPQIYKGSSFANLTGLGSEFTTADLFARISPYMLAINTSAGDDYYHWCDEDDVETWTPTVSNQAGNKQIRDLDGPIKAAVELNDSSIAIFTENQMHAVSYIGAPFLFGDERLLVGTGAVGPKAVLARGQLLFGFARQYIWMSDGASYQILSDGAVSDFVYENINQDAIETVTVQFWPSEQAVVFYYPTGDATLPNAGVAYHLPSQTWSPLSYGRCANDQAENQELMVIGDAYGRVWSQSSRTTPFEANDGLFFVSESGSLSSTYGSFTYGQGTYGGTLELS